MVIDKTSIETLKDIIDPDILISALGFEIFYTNDREIRGPCKIHGGDNKTAFCYKKDTKRFYCFTHGCETDDGGNTNNDVISLIMKVNRCSFYDAVKFMCELTGYDINMFDVNESAVAEQANKRDRDIFMKMSKASEELPELDERIVEDCIKRGADYFSKIGISDTIIHLFELGSYLDDRGVERCSIPIRDDSGRLVSISGRRTDNNDPPRYRLMKDFKKARVLYNLFRAKKLKSYYKNSVVVVEGFKALWRVYESGYKNVVAVMGKSISQQQVNLLIKSGFDYVFLMLDGDDGGKKGMSMSKVLLLGKIDFVPVYLPDEKSPDDFSPQEIKGLIDAFYETL